MMIYRLNESVDVTVETPVGETAEITIKHVPQQGTAHGPAVNTPHNNLRFFVLASPVGSFQMDA